MRHETAVADLTEEERFPRSRVLASVTIVFSEDKVAAYVRNCIEKRAVGFTSRHLQAHTLATSRRCVPAPW
jgi:hypothetical protein